MDTFKETAIQAYEASKQIDKETQWLADKQEAQEVLNAIGKLAGDTPIIIGWNRTNGRIEATIDGMVFYLETIGGVRELMARNVYHQAEVVRTLAQIGRLYAAVDVESIRYQLKWW